MRAALYIRVSTEDQAINGVSLAAQEERLRAYCVAKDWQTAKVYRDEGVSAGHLDRPALRRLLEDAKARRFEAVLVFKLDRLTRSVRDLGTLLDFFEKRDVALVSLTESLDATTATGRLMLNLLGSVSQWEREVIGERTALVLRHKRDRLEVYGQTPLGFRRVADRLEPVEKELAIVRRIYALRRKGMTLRAIADQLNAERIKTKTGKKWAPETVRYILANDLYRPYVSQEEGKGPR